MTTRFRLDAITLQTTEGAVHYAFESDLTVLAGPTGVGKTTLLELVKFGFGAGEARLAPIALDHVNDVIIDVTIGRARLRIARSIDQVKRKKARVTDLITQERLPDHHVGTEQPSLNTLLLAELGYPDDMRAAASGKSSNAGNRITFADIFSFMYIPQYEINRDIAGSQEGYLEPKRKAVFELLFGLTDPNILTMKSEVNKLNAKISTADEHYKTVISFLKDSHTTGRLEAEQSYEAAVTAQLEAEREIDSLRQELLPAMDRETQVLRDMLAEAERGLAEARAAVVDFARQQAEYVRDRRRVESDIARLSRMRDAGERLAAIEFSVCPRCMQSLTGRETPAHACRVCLQLDPVIASSDLDQYEVTQLANQLEEMDDQLNVLGEQLAATENSVAEREQLVLKLTRSVDSRTAERVTPRLQAFSDASALLATARAQQELLESVRRQWDRVTDLENETQALRAEQERLKAEISFLLTTLEARRTEIIRSISEEFQDSVVNLQIPGVVSAEIHSTNYLPVLNGKIFHKFSPPGGGVVTATQLAYWTSVLTVALRQRDTSYPAFLLIDSPRLALNTASELTAALYRRLVTQADANADRIQFIIADNELPASYRSHFAQIDFDYPNPTVSTIRHPGLANVPLIGEAGSMAGTANDDE